MAGGVVSTEMGGFELAVYPIVWLKIVPRLDEPVNGASEFDCSPEVGICVVTISSLLDSNIELSTLEMESDDPRGSIKFETPLLATKDESINWDTVNVGAGLKTELNNDMGLDRFPLVILNSV